MENTCQVNRGAKAFGDWLLTLRGGLCHTLADAKVPVGKGTADREPTDAERRHRRIVLAMSWLSVESEELSYQQPNEFGRHDVPTLDGKPQTVYVLREILSDRGVIETEIADWVRDCEASLQASVRECARWVIRSMAFDEAQKRVGPSMTREEIWDLFERFFGSREAYFGTSAVSESDNDEDGDTPKAADDSVLSTHQPTN